MNYYSPYRDTDENKKLAEKDEKVASQLNELGFVKCPQCTKKLVRVFAPRSGRKPVFRGDVQDYLRRMRKAMRTWEGKGAKSECHISGPEYTIVYNSSHFTKPYGDNLGRGRGYGHCGRGAYLGYSAVDVVARLFMKHHMIRRACIANNVDPIEVHNWLETVDTKELSQIFGYGFSLVEIENTSLWAGTYAFSEWKAHTVDYDIHELAPEWAAEMDPIVHEPPPVKGYRGKYTMNPTHGAVQYTNKERREIAVDLPQGKKYTDLEEDRNYYRVVDVRTSTGMLAKVVVTHESDSAKSISTMTRALDRLGAPRKFWVVQPWAYQGSSKLKTGDIKL